MNANVIIAANIELQVETIGVASGLMCIVLQRGQKLSCVWAKYQFLISISLGRPRK